MARIVLKNIYRYPLMVGMPKFLEDTLHLQNKTLQKGLAGFLIATVESLILCPFERLKTFMMTQEGGSWSQTFKSEKETRGNSLLREMFRGYLPLLCRQCVAWVAFLSAD
jgi:hypothetical protein